MIKEQYLLFFLTTELAFAWRSHLPTSQFRNLTARKRKKKSRLKSFGESPTLQNQRDEVCKGLLWSCEQKTII